MNKFFALATIFFYGIAFNSNPALAQGFNKQICQVKITNSLLGRAPTAEELAETNPLENIPTMLATDAFKDRFAGFVNSKFNDVPETRPQDEVVYNVVKNYVLKEDKPWVEIFTGKFSISGQNINARDDGLGYFSNEAWRKRYAGNEPEGYKIATVYRILNNTIGLKLPAVTVSDAGDATAEGRKAPACKACHYDGPYAFDPLARILDRKNPESDAQNISFIPKVADAEDVLGAKGVQDVDEVVNILVSKPEFQTNICRLAFEFLYGRTQSKAEMPLFNGCVTDVASSGKIQDALTYFISNQYCTE